MEQNSHINKSPSMMQNRVIWLVFAILLVVAGVALLEKNENWYMVLPKIYEKAAKNVIPVDSDKINPQNEGKLIHVIGELTSDEVLKDTLFNMSTKGLGLRREVLMFQWIEDVTVTKYRVYNKHVYGKVAGSPRWKTKIEKEYSYRQDWAPAVFNSYHATHYDSPFLEFESEEFWPSTSKIGSYTLTKDSLYTLRYHVNLEWSSLLPLSGKDINFIPSNIRNKATIYDHDTFYIPFSPNPYPDPSSPELGDIMISFVVMSPPDKKISIIGMQQGNSIVPYITKNGRQLFLISEGIHGPVDMLSPNRSDLRTGWVIRVIGFAVIALGLFLIQRFIATGGYFGSEPSRITSAFSSLILSIIITTGIIFTT